jgi:hypothetical protein
MEDAAGLQYRKEDQPMYSDRKISYVSLLGQAPGPAIERIHFVEAAITPSTADGRVTVSLRISGAMDQKKKEAFIKRFLQPMLRTELGVKCLTALTNHPHPVYIAWGNGRFNATGTVAMDRARALGGTGSAATIFIDENSRDWQSLPTIVANPDVGLFHELVHARYIQDGKLVNDEEEMERRVIGIGRYTDAKGTENHYRETRNLPRRCCWKKEQLEGVDLGMLSRSLRGQIGETPSPRAFTAGEKEMVALAIDQKGMDANRLSDQVFFVRHPDRNGRLIDPKTEPDLAVEWKDIKSRLVLPMQEAKELKQKGIQAMYAEKPDRALEFFDRARRISILPAKERVAITLDLGIASYKLKRFAAAIGYFEMVRSLPGIEARLKEKADQLLSRVKEEYLKAIPW